MGGGWLHGIELFERLGEGGRSTVYRGRREDRDLAVKIYKEKALAKHHRKLGQNLAQYEYERNIAFFMTPGLARYVAEPIEYIVDGDRAALVQELLVGPLYFFYRQQEGDAAAARLRPHLERIVECAHAEGLYDLDIHSLNVLVVEEGDGSRVPKLFDFNLIPFYLHPPNPFVAALLKVGLLHPRHRDRRLLRNFDSIGRRHRKLLRYYEKPWETS